MLNNIIELYKYILNDSLVNRIASIILSFLFPMLVLLFALRLTRLIFIAIQYLVFNKKIYHEIDNIKNISNEQEIIKESDYNPIEWK